MTTFKLNDNHIIERRNNTDKYIATIFPNDIAKIISAYDYDCYFYNLEGATYSFQYPHNSLFRIFILPDKRIVSDHYDWTHTTNNIKIWDPLTDKTISLYGHTSSILCLAIFADERLVSGSCDGTIKVWNLQTEKCEYTFENFTNNPDGHLLQVNSIDVLYNCQTDEPSVYKQKENYRIISASYDQTIKIWNLCTGKCDITITETSKITYNIKALPGSLTHGRILSVSYETLSELKIWNTQNGTCEMNLIGNNYNINCIGYISESSTYKIISGSSDAIKIWNAKTGKCEMTLNHSHHVEHIAVLQTGYVITGSAANRVFDIWDVKTGKCHSIRTDNQRVCHSSFASIKYIQMLSDGRIVSITDDNIITIWANML